jgi:hypothetical protein
VHGNDVLFVALDLQSTGWIDSAEDRLRVLQAVTVRDRARTALARRAATPPPVAVIAGDLNLVGSPAPLDTLLSTLAALAPVDAERLGERSLATWRNPGAPFAPGRLDYVLVPGTRLEAVNAFVFSTEDLPTAVLERLGLEAELSGRLSDHLVLVADLAAR